MLILMLFYQFYASLYEVVQSLALQHAVLQQGKVDKLVNNLVALCVVCINLFLLLALIVEFLCYIGKSILVSLRDFLVFSASIGETAALVFASLSLRIPLMRAWSLLSTMLYIVGISP